ncbi:MAG: UDP-3-O-(3-hydroxymyristoyl)glucosamine N-acyltransferase [Verrucomicrobiota bacterium]|nr:UDP-3-O-(3-hydroxymyristoyl)glucosamine N-acyltransferase [Verrucomicrobiota bacterium]
MKSPFSLKELAERLKARFVGDPNHLISGVNTLDEAAPTDLSFLANPRYIEAMKQSKAGVICVAPDVALPSEKNFLISDNPSATFQQVALWLLLPASSHSGFTGIHPSAVIHPDAHVDPTATIGPCAVIDRGTHIGARTRIGSNCSIGYDVQIGDDCILHPNSVIRERCRLGHRVILQPGAIIGSCGFGYTQDKEGRHQKLEQLGIVILEDDVEIGAHTTIDRSRFKATIIRQGSKIDNLCQIAHNVEIGPHNAIAAQTGIAGSAKTGQYVLLGGQVGVLGHVEVGDFVMIATRGGVSKSLKAGKYRGSPAIPITEYHRQEVHVRKLEEYARRIKELEQKLAALTNPR